MLKILPLLFTGLFFPTIAAALDIIDWTTRQNVPVRFAAVNDLPLVDIELSFRAGSAWDGDLPGLAGLVNALLIDGSGDMNAKEIAIAFEKVGARVSYGVSRDRAWINLRSLSDSNYLAPATDMLSNMITQPTFPEDALERDRQTILTGLAERQNQPGSIARQRFYELLYPDHPYQYSSSGTVESVGRIQRQDLIDFYRKYYVTNNLSMAISGDLTLDRAKQIARQLLDKLRSGDRTEEIPEATSTSRKFVQVNFDTPQAHIKIGMPVLKRENPDYFALKLGNHIFGGGGQARLMQILREEQGLTYGVYSSFTALSSAGPFEISIETSNHQVEQVLNQIDKMLRDYIRDGPTERELEAAKKNMLGTLALSRDSNRKIMSQLSAMLYYNLDTDYLDQYADKIESITAEQIRNAYQRNLDVDKLITLVVGSKLEDG